MKIYEVSNYGRNQSTRIRENGGKSSEEVGGRVNRPFSVNGFAEVREAVLTVIKAYGYLVSEEKGE